MALLRVIGVALVASCAAALVACNAAGADPNAASSRSAARPEGWKQLPAMATAVGAAARADGVTIDSVDAWGEPANGCYAVWLALHGASGDAPALADQVLAGLSRAGGPRSKESAVSGELVISELVKPVGREGVLAFAFANAPFRGRVRARLGGGRIAAVACFGNERAPRGCDATCGRVLEGSP
jgi:hypothetical protein